MNKLIKKLGVLFTAGAVAVSSVAYAASAAPETVSTGGHVVAFPGAEGGGMYTTGARGAIGSGDNIAGLSRNKLKRQRRRFIP